MGHPLRLRATRLAIHLRRALHPGALALPLMACAMAAVPAAYAQAQATQRYDIPAGPLTGALNRFGAEAGILLSFSTAQTADRHSPGVQGDKTVAEALAALLAGSSLQAAPRAGGGYVIRPVPDAAAAPAGAQVLSEVKVTAARERSATTEGTDSLAARAVSLHKGDQALKDIPQSISVMTRKQMDEQGITDLRDAANHITGTVGINGVGQGMVLSSRGFQIDAWQYDGVAVPRNQYSLGNWASEDLVIYDRLEVLRGASGLLQGTGSPGGAINLVRKRGQAEKTLSLTAKTGSWSRHGLQLDAGGPLNADGSLRGRVVLDEARSHSFVDYVNNRTRTLYAALDYDISPDTTVGVGVSRMDSRGRPFILGLPLFADGGIPDLPRSTFTGAWWNRANVEQNTVYADLNHRFNADWKFKLAASRASERNTSTHQRMSGDPVLQPDGSGVSYDDWMTDFDTERVGLDAYINGRFNALGLRHEVTVGASYSKYTTDDFYARAFESGANLFDIDHGRAAPTLASLLAQGGRQFTSGYDVQQKGLYGSWRVRLTESLTAIAGARTSWYDNVYTNRETGSQTTSRASAEITPYAGLVFALTPQWSVYGSYAGVFEPQSERTAQGAVLDPVKGVNYEAGIKGELMDGRLNTSLAVFRYDHKNRAVNDVASGFACDGWYCSTASGKVRSQGIEAEVSGEVLRNLQVMAGYTYNTTEYVSDPTLKGETFSTWTPRHMLRTWASYRFADALSGLTVGGGFTTQSHTLSYDRSFKVPGFTVANLRVGYQVTPEVNLAMNVNNVFDKRYVLPGFIGYTGASYGEPRNVMFTLKYTPRL